MHDVGVDVRLANSGDPPTLEEAGKVLYPARVFVQIARSGRLIVLAEIRLSLLVAHAVGLGQNRLAQSGPPLTCLEEVPRRLLLVSTGTLANHAAIHVVFTPEKAALFLLEEVTHHRPPGRFTSGSLR